MKTPSISVVFNYRNKKTKSGMYPIHLRITIDQRSKYVKIPTPQKISLSDWNSKNKGDAYIKNTHPFAFEINNKIRDYKQNAYEVIKRYYSLNKTITFEAIIQQISRKNQNFTFNLFVAEYIKDPKEKLEDATLTKYRTFLKHLNGFNKEIYFNDLTPELITNFKKYLEIDLNLLGSTIKSYFDKFKKIVTQAEKESYLDYHQTRFLFSDAKIKVNKAKRTYLEIAEILRLNDLTFSKDEQHLERNRDLFLFQVYTGFYYNDLKILKKENIKEQKGLGKYIIGERDKNGNTAIIPLFKFTNAMAIINKYASDDANELLFDESFFIQDQVYNRQLKELAKRAKIHKNITNKVARHTNVQLWIRYGAERPIVSKMVGHTKEATTKEYYDVFALDVFEGTKNVNFEELGL